MRAHNLTLVAAGVAFYAFLAFIPTLIAVVSVYGLVAEPEDVESKSTTSRARLPDEVEDFIRFQLTSIVEANDTGVSVTLAVSLAIALWSASGGMAALITGLHVAQEQDEPKSFVVKRGKAVMLTLAAVLLLVIVVFIVAVLPGIAADFGDAGRKRAGDRPLAGAAARDARRRRALYRLSVSDTRRGRLGLITPGTLTGATLLGARVGAASASTPRTSRGTRETYGSLATIVVLLFWLYLSALAILLGSEVDAITR